jgi:formylglycine-generating enzyme required for sulfatase activity
MAAAGAATPAVYSTPMAGRPSVFVSSTAKDLKAHRDRVRDAVAGLGYHCVRMEDFGARAWEADDFCRQKVAECDVFVGLVGHLFGSSPPHSEQSFTEREYDAARWKPRLMFVADDDFAMPARLREPDARWARQQAFRQRVRTDQIAPFFDAPDQLASLVITALRNAELEGTARAVEKLPGLIPAATRAAVSVLAPSRELLIDGERFVFIQGGVSPMGSDDGYPSERPRRDETVAPCFMQVFPVTNRLFSRFVQDTFYVTTAEIAGNGLCLQHGAWMPVAGADFRHPHGPGSTHAGLDDHPVVMVSWYDAEAFCKWFQDTTSFEARLPSETEWEYAGSNGKGSRWAFGDAFIAGKANVNGPGTTVVGTYPPNDFGLFDMTGNVYEWCSNTVPAELFPIPEASASGPEAPGVQMYALRGGSWHDVPEHARCSHRFSALPALSAANWGFRITLRLSYALLDVLARLPRWDLPLEQMFQHRAPA